MGQRLLIAFIVCNGTPACCDWPYGHSRDPHELEDRSCGADQLQPCGSQSPSHARTWIWHLTLPLGLPTSLGEFLCPQFSCQCKSGTGVTEALRCLILGTPSLRHENRWLRGVPNRRSPDPRPARRPLLDSGRAGHSFARFQPHRLC